eukprot:TRINITY_DN291_c0_g1_i1.p1 TRINITY_DN291_c0_g1~~TRINITY_DN291_c0_g1_i1.p1  ORF type:complete len:196 (+),score=30.67 TRINITY_DN291_c0_g1_i1:23-610(+)
MSTNSRSPSPHRGEKKEIQGKESPKSSRRDSPRSRSRSPRRSRSRSRSPRRERRGRSRSRSPRSRSRSASPRSRRNRTSPAKPCCILGIFGLNDRTDETALKDEFSKYGELDKVELIRDKRSGESKRFAFIYFKAVDEATKAKSDLDGRRIDGNIVRIDYSKTPGPHDPTPGRYLGKRVHHHSFEQSNERNFSKV